MGTVNRIDYGHKADWTKGDRVNYHPAMDCWMRGDQYGRVTSTCKNVVYTLTDKKRMRVRIKDVSYIRPA